MVHEALDSARQHGALIQVLQLCLEICAVELLQPTSTGFCILIMLIMSKLTLPSPKWLGLFIVLGACLAFFTSLGSEFQPPAVATMQRHQLFIIVSLLEHKDTTDTHRAAR